MSQRVNVSGEQYIRTLAHYIRTNERRLTFHQNSPPPSGHRRTDSNGNSSLSLGNLWSLSALTNAYWKLPLPLPQTEAPSPANSTSSHQRTIMVTLDHHHLYFLLSKFSEYNLDVGAFESHGELELQPEFNSTDAKDYLETSSISSSNSITSISSAMSSLSLFSAWQGWSVAAQQADAVPLEDDIRYIYRAFMQLAGLKLAIVTQTKIHGADEWSLGLGGLLSLTPFKNLSHLEIYRLPIKMLDGWDILQEKLEILTIQHGSINDICELFVDAVADSMKRRKSKKSKKYIESDEVPADIQDSNNDSHEVTDESAASILPAKVWPRITSINLAENALTFIANEPVSFITTCTHLDLSHNLLLSVPSALSQLYNLEYLNLSYNMIESVLCIYQTLSNVTKLDLRNNRIDNLCGLERVITLEYIDLRENRITDWAEIGRMNELSGIKDIFVESNPFTQYQPNFRVQIFSMFKENGLEIHLDGSGPSRGESRQLNVNTSPDLLKTPTAATLNPSKSMDSLSGSKPDESPAIPILKTKKKKRFVEPSDEAWLSTSPESIEKIIKEKSNKNKIKKPKEGATEPPSPEVHKKPKHRTLEIASSNSKLRKKRSLNLLRQKNTSDTPPRSGSPSMLSTTLSDSEVTTAPLSASPVESGLDYQQQVMNLREESGTSWLKVLSHMEYSKKGDSNATRQQKVEHDESS